MDFKTALATTHALWDFEWADAEGWASLVGFYVWWSLGAYLGLYLLSIAYRVMGPGGLSTNA